MSGANAHVVLEQPPDLDEDAAQPEEFAVLTISARTPEALRELAIRHRTQLQSLDARRVGDYCWSVNTGRTAFEHRLAIVAEGRDGLLRGLRSFERNDVAGAGFLQGAVRSGESVEPSPNLTSEERSPHRLASLWVRGAAVDWHSYYGARRRRCIAAPTYPFQRQRYWLQGPGEPSARPFIERHFASPLLREQLLETHIGKSRFPYLQDHRIFGRIVVPAAWHVSLLLSASLLLFPGDATIFEDLVFGQALALEDDEEQLIQIVAAPASSGELSFRIISCSEPAAADTPHLVHATGKMRPVGGGGRNKTAPLQFAGPPVEVDPEAFFRAIARLRIDLGPAFRWLDAPVTDYSIALAGIQAPLGDAALAPYELHPGLVDTCFQLLLASLPEEEFLTFVPLTIESLTYHPDRSRTHLRAEAQRASSTNDPSERLSGEIRLLNGDGQPVLEVSGFMGRAATAGRLLRESRPAVLSEIVWQPVEKTAGKFSFDQPWLIVSDGAAVAAAVARAIRGRGGHAIECLAGDSLPSLPARLAGIMHFGGAAGWNSLLRLLQNVWGEEETTCPELCVFTYGAQPIGESACDVQQAPILGMARVLASEMPQVRCARVDLDPARPEASALAVIASGFPSGEDEIAERAGRIYAPRIRALAAMPAANTPPIAADRTYLISGGWGGLGLHIAAWLVDRGARHLVLLGRRRPAPVPTEIGAWEARGVSVRLIEADVCNAARVHKLFHEELARVPALAGVVHAAGLVDDGALLSYSPERFAAVLAPKQIGGWLLHEATSRMPLDFFVCFSSAAALLGSSGQGSYAAANASLDALAHYRRACGLPAVSIDWGPWSGSGMAARAGQRNRARWSDRGIGALSPEEGVAQFAAALTAGPAQVAALPIDWKKYLESHHTARPVSLFAALAPASRPRAAASTNGKSKDLREIVQHAVSQVLDAQAAAETQRSLFELGLDSISAIELRTSLQEALGRPLRSTLVFDHPTIEALVQALTPPEAPRDAPAVTNGSSGLGHFAAMSEQELEALLLRKLDFHEGRGRHT
jgi:acyl transferase domain-containing protein